MGAAKGAVLVVESLKSQGLIRRTVPWRMGEVRSIGHGDREPLPPSWAASRWWRFLATR
jgi:hypothetical protein